MMANRLQRAAAMVAALSLAACATPQVALDQANNGAALSMSLQNELDALRAAQANLATLRLASVRRQRTMMADYDAATAFDDRVELLAGAPADAKLVSALRSLADSRVDDDKQRDAAIAALDARLAEVLSPVPGQDAKLAATELAMAALGQELRPQVHVRVVASFAVELKKAIDDNKAKAGALPNAPAAPAQSPAKASKTP